jgi:monoamine oxidase
VLIQRVLIAGAGLSGLAIANELARARLSVTVVEAKDRIGGRVWTVRAPFAGGGHGELGAEFIDDDHRRMRTVAARVGVPLVRVLRRGFTHRYRGDGGEFEISRDRGWQELRDALAPLVRQYQLARGIPDADRVRELSTFSVREWLRREEVPRRVHGVADAMRGFFLADAEQLSALPLAAEMAQGGSPAQTPISRVEGGTGRLVAAMGKDTPARVLLNHRLHAIRHAVDRVVCSVADERGLRRDLEADALVVTLPAAALAEIEITPLLPERQWRAVRSLRYGPATKAVLQTRGDLFGGRPARAFATDTGAGAFWDATEGQSASPYRMVGFLAGGSASPALAARLRDGADAVVSDQCWLRRGGGRTDVIAHATWTWERDPFARGGYAYLDPGFDPAWLPLLSQRAGRLFFAGEHTSERYQGYMEGALESAERVADEILRR